MTPVRNEVSIGLSHETCYLVGGLTFGGGRGVFQIALMSRGILVILGGGGGGGASKFCWLSIFYWAVGIWGWVILTIWAFHKVKTFCKQWTSIKVKISKNYLYKEYEIQKMVED